MNNKKRPRKRKKRTLLISVILSVLFVACVLGLLAALPIFKIDGAEVTGNRLVSSDEIVRLANVPIGDSLFLTSFKNSKKRILQLPAVKDVHFSRLLPSKVLIRVEERKEAVICVMKNQSLILDKDGIVLNPQGNMGTGVSLPDISGLPVMNGLSELWLHEGKYVKSDVGRDVLKLLADFENFIVPQKLQIDVSDIGDVKLLVDDVLMVRIGDVNDLAKKMGVFQSIYSKIRDKKDSIQYIDVSLPEFPVVRFR